MSKTLEYAKAIAAAVIAAAVTALAGVDWQGVVGAALASGITVERIPNRKRPRLR